MSDTAPRRDSFEYSGRRVQADFEYSRGIVEHHPVRVVGNERWTITVTNEVGVIDILEKGEPGEFVLERFRVRAGGRGRPIYPHPSSPPGEFRLPCPSGRLPYRAVSTFVRV